MKTVTEVLRGAVQVIDARGWCQDFFQDLDGHVCAIGALRIAAGSKTGHDSPWGSDWVPYSAARDTVEDALGLTTTNLGDWNDEPGRTADEVKAALLAAAERAS